ncbi:MAG: hypothetical protein ACLPZR_01580 [Solirubrobacteraceae bacterium]
MLFTAGHGDDPAQPLERVLAVLRRPQTPADRSFPASAVRFVKESEPSGETIVPALTRLAASVPCGPSKCGGQSGEERIFIVVFTPGSAFNAIDRIAHAHGDRVSLAQLLPGNGRAVGAGDSPAAELAYPANALPIPEGGCAAAVVPDGVVRVAWTFGGVPANQALEPGQTSPAQTFFATVHNNVAVAAVPDDLGQAAAVI